MSVETQKIDVTTQCIERRRLETAERDISEVKVDLTEIKGTLKSIDSEIRTDLNKLSTQFQEFTSAMQAIMIRSEERDKRTSEIFCENRTSFDRFAKDIKALETIASEHAKADAKQDSAISSLEKIVYGGFGSMGAVLAWLISEIFHK
jgi:hypothetical protein